MGLRALDQALQQSGRSQPNHPVGGLRYQRLGCSALASTAMGRPEINQAGAAVHRPIAARSSSSPSTVAPVWIIQPDPGRLSRNLVTNLTANTATQVHGR